MEYIRRLETYVLAEGKKLYQAMNKIGDNLIDFEKQYQKYNYRKNIASRIIARPESLKTTLPRAKGHLIWLLTRHDAKGDIPAAMWGEWELRGTGYKYCTKAIDVILTSIQSQKEWIEVFAGIRSDSDKNTGGHNPHRKALNEFYEHYAGRKSSDIENIKNRLPENMGWKTAWNDNPAAMQESQILLAKYEVRDGTLPETLICFDETQNNGTMMA